jgi:hypothetical protein
MLGPPEGMLELLGPLEVLLGPPEVLLVIFFALLGPLELLGVDCAIAV